ncbi:MAG: phytoene desaturase family protein [Gemmatimonadota bacterium]
MRIGVIGAGFGGLAAAIRLRSVGHEVVLCEALDSPGGRARTFADGGFTFDAGPTIITAPWMIDELFAAAGHRAADHVRLVPLDPFYNVRFDDGSVFRYSGREDDIISEIHRFEPRDVAGYQRFAREAEKVFAAGFALIDKPFLTPGSMLRAAPDLLRLRAWRSVATMAASHFRDERLRQVFSFHPLLVGGNPFDTTSIYALIHHLEKRWGVWFVMGGTGALVAALAGLFTSIGGTLRLGCPVSRIVTDPVRRRVTGIVTADGDRIGLDAVISNADVEQTLFGMLDPAPRRSPSEHRIRRYSRSMSLFVICFGTTRQYPQMAHHEILMGPRYRELLTDIFRRKVLAPDFSLYLHRPTATDPALAPPGCDSWYVLAPVPHLGGNTDWAREGDQYRDAIFAHLERRWLPDLTKHVVSERRFDPRYFRDTLGSPLGSAFSIEPTLLQSAWFRTHNRSPTLNNLYFVGAGTHPGAGVPGVLASAKIAADLIGAA